MSPIYKLYLCATVLCTISIVMSETDRYTEEVISEIPVHRMTVEVLYNTSSRPQEETERQHCAEHYARTFLTNFILTEYVFDSSCQALTGEKVNVRHSVVARVRLLGPTIELSTHMNISIKNPVRSADTPIYHIQSEHSPGGYVTEAWQGRRDILACVNTITQELDDPIALQENYNRDYAAKSRQRMDLFEINSDRCQLAEMHPVKFNIVESDWICPNEHDYYFDAEHWQCVLGQRQVTTTTAVPLSTTQSTVSTTQHQQHTQPTPPIPEVTPTTTTLGHLTTTENPMRKLWTMQVLNHTGSITITEGDDPLPITIQLTVNRTQLCARQAACMIKIKLVITNSKRALPKCRSTGDPIPQLVLAEPAWGSDIDHCRLLLDVSGEDNEEYVFTRTLYITPMLDMKYDGVQRRKLLFSVSSTVGDQEGPSENNILSLPIFVRDADRKATCKSVNDPHITTFDGLEYNNFYEGEFVLYRHTRLPYKVHVIYQKCSPGVPASCNCAVAIQSDDDVIVIDRCRRDKKPFNRIHGTRRESFTKMTVDLYLNGELNPGTEIFEESDGQKYVIYLPHGTYVKVMASGDLLNIWVVASPKDRHNTEGLCGTNDMRAENDLRLRNGEYLPVPEVKQGERPHPGQFCREWQVDLFSIDSIFHGVSPSDSRESEISPAVQYCDCTPGRQYCNYKVDISVCDVLQGEDVTHQLLNRSRTPNFNLERRRRSVDNNIISVLPDDDPIIVDPNFIPPVPSWDNNPWSYSSAQDFCLNHVRRSYNVGQLCSQIPAVDFNQDIQTCIEDIQTTGNTSWAHAARDAMKEQCIEEVQRNGSVSSDIANAISNAICINDCSTHGKCVNGSCVCDRNWYAVDCSISMGIPPYSDDMSFSGLCDTRYMPCDRVIVYGDRFVRNANLTCHLQLCEVAEDPHQFRALHIFNKTKPLFINFNAVECPIPTQPYKAPQPYLVSVSNDGVLEHASDPLLFLPFDSACYSCSTNSTSCAKRQNSCRIDGRCYLENDRSPTDPCLICKPYAHELQWTTDADSSCRSSWLETFEIPNWFIAVSAALGGSVIGVIIGFLLYKCCCKHRKKHKETNDTDRDSAQDESDASPFNDVLLHRNTVPSFNDDPFMDIAFRSPEVEETYFQPASRPIQQNGIDSATYF